MAKKKKEYKPEEVKREVYRKVFLSDEGRIVLTDILNDLGHMIVDSLEPEQLILQNYAKVLLSKLGIWQPHNIKNIVDAYLNMQYTQGEK